MSPVGLRIRGGHGPLLIALSLWAALAAWLLRLPCRVPGRSVEELLPALCASELALSGTGGATGGFFTGGPAGDRPALVGMLGTVAGWVASQGSVPPGAGGGADVSLVIFALLWTATVLAVSALSGRGRIDAFVLAPAPVAVLAGFGTWDLPAVLLMVLALLLHARDRPGPAGVCLGLAASVALFPLVALLAVLLLAVRHRDARDAVVVLVGTVLTWLLVNGPFMVSAWDRWRQQAVAAVDRTGEGNSLWSVWERVVGPGSGAVPDGAGPPVLLGLVVGLAAVLALILSTRHEPDPVQVALLLLGVLVLLQGGYSPVHALWLAPLVALSRRHWPEFAAWQLVEVLWWTTLVLPAASWPALPGTGATGWDTQDVLAVVRVLFLLWFVLAVAVDVLRGRRAEPAGVHRDG